MPILWFYNLKVLVKMLQNTALNVALNSVDITNIAAACQLSTRTIVSQASAVTSVLFVNFMFIPMMVDISNLSR